MQGTQLQSLGQEDPLDEEMVTPSGILDWGIPQTEEPARLQSLGLQRLRHDCGTWLDCFVESIHFHKVWHTCK